MILVDTSVWVDHLRRGDARLSALLGSASVLMHPFVVGEMACGSMADRAEVIGLLQALPSAVVAEPHEVLAFVETQRLWGKGIGYVDVHLLASAALTSGAVLWTRDRRLGTAAEGLGVAYRDVAAH